MIAITLLSRRSLRWLLVGVALSAPIFSVAQGQSSQAPGNAGAQASPKASGQFTNAVAAAARTKAFDDAKGRARAGDLDAAEKAISAQNQAKANSADWYVESADGLTALAHDLAREGQPETTAKLVTRVLDNLKQAAAKAKTAKDTAKALTRTGYVHEYFTGNIPSAIQSYRDALKAAPDDKHLKETLARVEAMDANLRARLTINSKK